MQFLTHVIGRKVIDSTGENIGRVNDVIVKPADPLPIVTALVLTNGEETIIAWNHLREEVGSFSLLARKEHLVKYKPGKDEIMIKKSVLDKQIVDTHNYKVVRVNDVRFVDTPEGVRLLGVDASTRGLFRELGIEWVVNAIRFITRKPIPEKVIAWNDVETLEQSEGAIKLKIPLQKLSRLHPSDIADIIEQLNPMQRADIIESLDVETAADVLPEASPEIQAAIIEDLDPEHAADVLDEMDPDEAADILGDLSDERTEEILKEMQPEEAEDVRELLVYDDETAGGLMTTDYVSIKTRMSAQEVINYLRDLSPDAETIYYIYVVDENDILVGVLSLRDLIVADPKTPAHDFMSTRVLRVNPSASLREVAELFQKYNLLALPVTDYDGELKGIITVDDMLENIPTHAWPGKPSRRRASEEAEQKAG